MTGSVVQADTIEHLTIYQDRASVSPRPMRSAYLRQVERIAPPKLLDRDTELAELASFCREAQRGPYVWWRAGPWAGKSALLSTFVVNPPRRAGAVWLVSFFITARLAAQDTREAFTTALTEQLCALLGQDLPVGVDEAAREAALLDLLAQAARACQRADGRLVLVVDGLDEDRGMTTGPGANSIAALLPGQPPAGMRVIIAGRPNPPIPDDVPDWHPLRDPSIVRLLGDSSHARDLQRLGQSELKRLLTGTLIEQDLLGLLTAARGGLSGPDLRELTGADLVAVEEILHSVAGRTFTRQLATWTGDTGSQVYLLGHEELDHAARYYLGTERLSGYRDRLHAWAERYRAPTDGQPLWPRYTPGYLLAGYPRMLATTADTDRLLALAIDAARHDRMLDLSGGDTAALTEITTCQSLLLDCPEPDLYALARLSHHRSQLESRNANIPTNLPAVWVTLGQTNRAEQLARAITSLHQRAEALAEVAGAVAVTGDHERAEQIARAITDPDRRAEALAGAVAAAGDHERAEQIARAITNPELQSRALAGVAAAVTTIGDYHQAQQIAQTIVHADLQSRALAGVAAAVAAAGDDERASRLATDAERIAWDLTVPGGKTSAVSGMSGMAGVVAAVAATGDQERAEQIARAITNPELQSRALAGVAAAVAAAGDDERASRLATDAEQIARAITHPHWQAEMLAGVAGAVGAAGDYHRAEQIARSIIDPDRRAEALAGAVAAAGDYERAEQIARAITNPNQWGRTLAAAEAAAGDYHRAQQIARLIPHPYQRQLALAEVAGAVAVTGDHERAEQIARAITDPELQSRALVDVAAAVAVAGDDERASRLATDAEQIFRTIAHPRWPEMLAGAVAAAGDHERAEQIARAITDPELQSRALAEVANGVGVPRAGHLLGRAFVLESWLTPLPSLARLYPQEMIRIADAVYADEPPRDTQ